MVNIKERLQVLFPDITFGPFLSEADCVISNNKISEWGRPEKQPTIPELNAVPQAQVDAVLAAAAEAEQAILTKQEIADLKHASPDSLELLGKGDQWIDDDVEAMTAGSTNAEVVAGMRESHKKQRRISRDILNALKAMVK